MNRWGPPKRTEAAKKLDAILFIANARDHVIAATDAADLCNRYGVQRAPDRREIEVKLLARQAQLRRAQLRRAQA